MSYRTVDGLLTVNASGIQVTSGAASAVVAIPNDASGTRARYVYVASTGTAYIRPGVAGTTCTVNDFMLVAGEPVVLNVQGFTSIAYIQETAAAKINITPVEAG